MRANVLALLCGAVTAATASADIFEAADFGTEMLDDDAYSYWLQIQGVIPDAKLSDYFLEPKPHKRRPDSEWSHITRGSEVDSVWTDIEQGSKETIEEYSLRVKPVDPSELGVDPDVKQYSGYLDDDSFDKHLFFWFFESRNDPTNDPVVLWLNGGPGCSSMTGLFMELGPSSVDQDIKLVYNEYAWNSNASVIFLDQPVNTGFSYSKKAVKNTAAASKDVYAFLTLFFKQYPEYGSQDFHIAGESYAGHYIPVFAADILDQQDTNINLKSILIGNGLTDVHTQYAWYGPFGCGKGGYPAVLNNETCSAMESAVPVCQTKIQSCYDTRDVPRCVSAVEYCNREFLHPFDSTGLNIYDIRMECEDPQTLCYSIKGHIDEYLNQQSVMDAIGAEVSSFQSCNYTVNSDFNQAGDWGLPTHLKIPQVLEKIPVLIYAGDADYICNWLGNYAWADTLEWPGKSKFNAMPLDDLLLGGDNKKSGQVKSYSGFAFMRIFQAGHMVPYDQPEASLDFFNRWLGGEWNE